MSYNYRHFCYSNESISFILTYVHTREPGCCYAVFIAVSLHFRHVYLLDYNDDFCVTVLGEIKDD